MTFKPMTYFVSFSLFVLLFMGLGGYAGYRKIADHLRVQAFLEARPLAAQVLEDPQGPQLRWEERLPLATGGIAHVAAGNRRGPITIRFTDGPGPLAFELALADRERLEDLRIDPTGRYLLVRVLADSKVEAEQRTWLCSYDLRKRKLLRRSTVNPILLPARR